MLAHRAARRATGRGAAGVRGRRCKRECKHPREGADSLAERSLRKPQDVGANPTLGSSPRRAGSPYPRPRTSLTATVASGKAEGRTTLPRPKRATLR